MPGIDRPQRRGARTLQVDPGCLIAQQIPPMRTPVALAAALRGAVPLAVTQLSERIAVVFATLGATPQQCPQMRSR